jgi:hypothetical protein
MRAGKRYIVAEIKGFTCGYKRNSKKLSRIRLLSVGGRSDSTSWQRNCRRRRLATPTPWM